MGKRWWLVGLILCCVTSCRLLVRTKSPRFGGLDAFETRKFSFEHDIQLFSAKNGLKVALIPDARTNLVSVDVRYTVGAAEDPDGRAGLAHLVEHLMFTLRADAGGPTLGDELAAAALSYNAYTTWDETHYTSTALAVHLPELLELEARRLEATCDQIDEAVFVRERDVVLEEQAQRGGGISQLGTELRAAAFGADHPYARGVGTREIADVTKQEACDFIVGHYAPDRAILVVTGAIDVDDATARIGRRFGPMARRSTLPRELVTPAELDDATTEHVADIDDPTALLIFDRPAWGAAGDVVYQVEVAALEAALHGKDSDTSWIVDTSVFGLGGMQASTVVASISVTDEARLDDAVQAFHDTVAKVDAKYWLPHERKHYYPFFEGVLPTLLGRLRAAYAASYDDFDGRGAWIADYLQYTLDSHLMLDDLAEIDMIPVEPLARSFRASFSGRPHHVALVRPSGQPTSDAGLTIRSSGRDYDLAIWRPEVDPAEAARPLEAEAARVEARVEELELANGLRVLLAPDPASPVIDARVLFPVGTNADPPDRRGLALLSAALLDHDYDANITSAAKSRMRWALDLGAVMSADVDETSTMFRVEGLAVFADWHVWRLAWLLELGTYDSSSLKAVRARVERSDPTADRAALLLRTRLFGADHPYAAPTSALAGVAEIRRRDLVAFRKAHYSLRGATLIVAGGFDADAMKDEISRLFVWRTKDPAALPPPPTPSPAAGPGYLAIHDDDASQVQLTVGFAAHSNPARTRAARMILRGMLADRVRGVREALGASYGVDVGYIGGPAGTALIVTGAVDPTRATEALQLVLDALAEVAADPGTLAESFVRARRLALGFVLADACGASDLASELQALVENDLPLDGFDELARQVGATTLDDIAALVAKDLVSSRMAVTATGPAGAVDAAIAAVAGGAEVETYDSE